MKAKLISAKGKSNFDNAVIGVFATCDPRIDEDSRKRAQNITKLTADSLAGKIKLPDGKSIPVVYSNLLVDTEKEADIVARQFKENGVNVLVGVPDTWAFPQLTLLSLLSHFPDDTPLNFTCGNSGPRPGVVFTHAVSGAVAQSGRLMHINVGSWPDKGLQPKMTKKTLEELIDWCYAAVTFQTLKGKRVVIWGHDSMGMETALPHIIQTRNTFGLEITRLDMKLLADMLKKKAYNAKEFSDLRSWFNSQTKGRVELKTKSQKNKLEQSLAMYLITKDVMKDLSAVGGGFMSQLEWGSDSRGEPLPVADIMESLFNSTFDHTGNKAVVPYATEADVQGLLTMLFMTYLSGGNPPLFMDFRKVWEPWEVERLAADLNISLPDEVWVKKGFVDGDNSGSASFNWAALPNTNPSEIMKQISFPIADKHYFPGGGNSVTFVSPGGIHGIAGRLAYSSLTNMFSLIWDEAETVEMPKKFSEAVCNTSTPTWPHTFITPKHASMHEYKHYAPANHLHMTWGLKTNRLQYWMDLSNVLSVTPWEQMETGREGVDRPIPLLYLLNGGEDNSKIKRAGKM